MASLKNESSNIPIYGMLLGASGAGKSSLVNSLMQLCKSGDDSPKKKYPYIPTARINTMGGHTMMREPVVLTDTLTVVDNRGWHDWGNEAALRELTAQIRGERTYNEDVSWTDTGDSSAAANARPIKRVVSHKIDSIAIVINGLGGAEALENIGNLIETCRKNIRRVPSFVITHKDKMLPDQIENTRSYLDRKYNVDPETVFFIKNVTTRADILDKESKSNLSAFVDALVSDGEIGANTHENRDEELIASEILKNKEEAQKLSDDKMKLEKNKLTAAQIRMDTETNRVDQLAELDLKRGQIAIQSTLELNTVEKEKAVVLKDLQVQQQKDLHVHQKKLMTDRSERLPNN